MNWKRFAIRYNKLYALNKKRGEEIEKKIEFKEDVSDLDIKDIEKDIHTIALFFLRELEDKKEFVFGKTRLEDKSKVFVEDEMISLGSFRARSKYEVGFINDYISGCIETILPNKFINMLRMIRTLEKEYDKKVENYQETHFFEKKVKIPTLERDYGPFSFKTIKLMRIFCSSKNEYELEFYTDIKAENDVSVQGDNLGLINDRVYALAKTAVRQVKLFRKKQMKLKNKYRKKIYNEIKKAGYMKYVMVRRL